MILTLNIAQLSFLIKTKHNRQFYEGLRIWTFTCTCVIAEKDEITFNKEISYLRYLRGCSLKIQSKFCCLTVRYWFLWIIPICNSCEKWKGFRTISHNFVQNNVIHKRIAGDFFKLRLKLSVFGRLKSNPLGRKRAEIKTLILKKNKKKKNK